MNNVDTTSSDDQTLDELRAESLAADDNANTFHATFESNVRELMEPVRDVLIESVNSCAPEEIIGQLLMNLLGNDHGNPDRLDVDTKARLVRIADHLGPDWAQALYRAAVFITKVA